VECGVRVVNSLQPWCTS